MSTPPGLLAQIAASGTSLSLPLERLFDDLPNLVSFIVKVRIDEALHRLTTTAGSPANIARATGFCDQSAVTRHFHRLTGLPLGALRAKSAR